MRCSKPFRRESISGGTAAALCGFPVLRLLVCTILTIGGLSAQTAARYDGTPLLKAKLALDRAQSTALEHRYADTAAALRDASKALGDFARDFPGPHAETADFIRREIDSYAPGLARRDRNLDPQDARDRIELWREPVDHWYAELHPSAPQ